jgi:hypothetical protein
MLPHVVMAVFVGVVGDKETVDEAVLDVALVATGKRAPLRGPGQLPALQESWAHHFALLVAL